MDAHEILVDEYGLPPHAGAGRIWARICRGPERLHISHEMESWERERAYVRACRRLDAEGWPSVDGRIVAVGLDRVPPREWVLGESRDGRAPRTLADFVAWWNAMQELPGTVGSSYNAAPETAFALWSSSPAVRRAASLVPPRDWHRLVRRDGRLCRRALRHAAEIGRACRRASYAAPRVAVDTRALRRLGGLCPELQAVAIAGAWERSLARGGRIARVQDLDWAEVARLAPMLAQGGARVRAALAYRTTRHGAPCRRFVSLAGDREDIALWLCPAYPAVSVEQATRLCRGETPEQVSAGVLTRAEAHRWLSEMPLETPLAWLTRTLPGVQALRSELVARWLLDVRRRGGWGGLTRERQIHGPAGAVATIHYIARIDEIQEEDLVRGVHTSVDAAFRSAAERAGSAWLESSRRDHRVLAAPPPWRLYPSMRALVTRAQLVREGEEMHHCVGGYASAVERGQSVILALNVRGHRSTVELSPAGEVYQHHGPHDAVPHPLCAAALDRFLRWNRLAQRRAA